MAQPIGKIYEGLPKSAEYEGKPRRWPKSTICRTPPKTFPYPLTPHRDAMMTPNHNDSIRLDPYFVAVREAPKVVLLQCL